ncbi:hypothetical protein GCM10012275_52640 [Longimycelium tulufanense]|uniref:Lysozyme n=1 Tax=Longimycelium tulufanense TaxID=907463 RepID=A0A8J3FWA4_9PSEU|nr:glycoside hydrolase family 25 protein [Longimycelium tulufanense]GGM75447.1 hypothetical protein GCM10012275_52640 [Longimycelium tulufanense]
MLFGVDVSNHQRHFDFHRARAEGYDFAILKCSEGSTFRDGMFHTHLRNARAAGIMVAAYHYQRSAPASAQADLIVSMVPREVSVAVDVEEGSGGVNITRALITELQHRGYRVPLLYLPRWYWDRLGRPSLAGLPPLWASWYPDNTVRHGETGLALIPEHVWNGYGGLDVVLLQFTSSGAVADHPQGRIDLNAYRGSHEQCAVLLGGTDDMFTDDDRRRLVELYEWWQHGIEGIRHAGDHYLHLVRTSERAAALQAAVAGLTPTDPAAVAQALRPELSEVIREVLGEDNTATADRIVDKLAERLGRVPQ